MGRDRAARIQHFRFERDQSTIRRRSRDSKPVRRTTRSAIAGQGSSHENSEAGTGCCRPRRGVVAENILAHTAGMSGRDLHKVVQELAVAPHPRQPYFGGLVLALDKWRRERSLERNEDATWDRLIVSHELKETLQVYCKILKNYEEFKTQGINMPRGLLLFGPSGTGKTQIARTLSCEGGISFIGCATSDIKQGWIGHSAQKLREIFTRARSQAPTILFIDELDIVAPSRGTYHDTITTEIVGELTQQMDGIRPDGPAVFVLALAACQTFTTQSFPPRPGTNVPYEIHKPHGSIDKYHGSLPLGHTSDQGRRQRVLKAARFKISNVKLETSYPPRRPVTLKPLEKQQLGSTSA
jgi:ATPase family protein associated with various cellular activities (AAA)